VNVTVWDGVTPPGLSDVKSARVVPTLCPVIGGMAEDEISTAMDIRSQRELAVQVAKATKGGAWGKAENLELLGVPSRSFLVEGRTGLTV